ncbi:MAG: hypothetical protein RMK18_06765 [Armatimonadota bacterium]|nr:hypothetical protein [Armatimonadota bacterium]MCX7777541.1 hypothetical protein [Armatimonadota bacterium]MDW8025550.1 hypothetical protein [Armatimonadota bacterium]
MTQVKMKMPVLKLSETNDQKLPIVVHDDEIERLIKQWEEERKATKQPQPRQTLRREPYAHD